MRFLWRCQAGVEEDDLVFVGDEVEVDAQVGLVDDVGAADDGDDGGEGVGGVGGVALDGGVVEAVLAGAGQGDAGGAEVLEGAG